MAATAHFLMPCISRLELFCGDNLLSVATGFLVKNDGRWFLVTNWHVLSGRNPHSGQPLHRSCAVPDRCKAYGMRLVDEQINFPTIQFDLIDRTTEEPLWFEHPLHGRNVDVGAFHLEEISPFAPKDILGDTGHDPDMFLDLGAEVLIPGFPLGLSGGGALPIWKRASLATSLEFSPGMSTYFLVDTATREGMSGAPCLAISNWRHYRLNRAAGKMTVVEGAVWWRLLGVYSGRLNPSDTFEAQLGVVWRETLMLEVLASQKRANIGLQNNS